MDAWKHARSSAAKFGGKAEDYIHLHEWIDSSKLYFGDWRHRSMFHHTAGICMGIEKFGHTIKNSNGRDVGVREILELHVVQDCGKIPTPQDWLLNMQIQPWMAGQYKTGRSKFIKFNKGE